MLVAQARPRHGQTAHVAPVRISHRADAKQLADRIQRGTPGQLGAFAETGELDGGGALIKEANHTRPG